MRSTSNVSTTRDTRRSASRFEIQIAVEIARKPHERPPVIVSIAIERAIEKRLHRVLDERREQNRHERGQQRGYPLVGGSVQAEHALRSLQQPDIDDDNRAERRGVHDAALQNDLDVEQPVAAMADA